MGKVKKGTNMKNEKGITLIALVVTIIVLLILAGITIGTVINEDGILKSTQDVLNQQKNLVDNTLGGLNSVIDVMSNDIIPDPTPGTPEEPELKGAITSKTVWKNGKATVTLSTTKGYRIDYQIIRNCGVCGGDGILYICKKCINGSTNKNCSVCGGIGMTDENALCSLCWCTACQGKGSIECTIPECNEGKTGESQSSDEWLTGPGINKDVIINGLDHGNSVVAKLTGASGASGGEATITVLDKTAPTMEIASTDSTSNSITVNVGTVTDNEWGMLDSPTYTYYYKTGTESYTQFKSTTSKTATQSGLKHNTKYTVKVEVKDKAGNLGHITKDITTEKVTGATEGLLTGAIIANGPTWSGGKASITLSTTTSYTIQYKIGTSGTWTTGTSVTGLDHNTTVFARLKDASNNYGEEASITVMDGDVPEVTTISATTSYNITSGTTKSISATATHTDNQSGVNITSCKWVLNSSSSKLGTTSTTWDSATAFSSNGQEISKSVSKGTYYFHILTEDIAGNKTETVSSKITVVQKVTALALNKTTAEIEVGLTDTLTATVTPSTANNKNVNWTSSNKSIATVSTATTASGTAVTITAKAVGTATITATAADGSGKTASCEVTVTAVTSGTAGITVTGPTWSSGKASITLKTTTGYTIQYQKNSTTGTWTSGTGVNASVTVTGLLHNDTVYARLINTAGKYGEEATILIQDGTAPSSATISATTSYNIASGTTKSISATVTHTDNQSGVNITSCKWILNSSSSKLGTTSTTWNSATAFSSNGQQISKSVSKGTYYFHILTEDIAGNKTETVSSKITVVQKVTALALNKTTAQIEVGLTDTLTATVTPSTANNKNVDWTSSNPSIATVSATTTASGTAVTITAKAVGTATITATAADGSGKKATCEVTVTAVTSGTAGITVTGPTWSSGKASITLKTTTGYTIQYQKNSTTGTWTSGTGVNASVTVTGLLHNDTVYARLINTAGKYGEEATILIQDGTAPSSATISFSSSTITTEETTIATIVHKDNQSGVNITSCKWVLKTSATKIGTTASLYTGGAFSTSTQTSSTATTSTNKITLNQSTSGTYYLHVLTVDKAGKATETVSSAITINPANATPVINSVYASNKTTSSMDIKVKATDEEGETLTYKLYIDGRTFSDTANATSSGKTVTFSVTGLDEYTWYDYRVEVTDGNTTVEDEGKERTYCRGGELEEVTCSSCRGTGDGSEPVLCRGGNYGVRDYKTTTCSCGEQLEILQVYCMGCGTKMGTTYDCSCGAYEWPEIDEPHISGFECGACDGRGYTLEPGECGHGYTEEHD